jgi:SAM-dependent methyltransferase
MGIRDGVDMRVPHDSWAEVYDDVSAADFGRLYTAMTNDTLRVIRRLLPTPGDILDVGAGTGRLATPLAAAGHRVVAVEPSAGMLAQVRDPAQGPPIERHCCHIGDFASAPRFDLALCVFTVVSYFIDEASLHAAFRRISRSVRPGGLVLMDVPSRALFTSRRRKTLRMRRMVTITAISTTDVFTYREDTRIQRDGEWRQYGDEFPLRWWSDQAVLKAARAEGLMQARRVTDDFPPTGGEWWVLGTSTSEERS